MENEKEMYEYWLAACPVSGRKKKKLKERSGGAKALYYIEEKELKNWKILTETEVEKWKTRKQNWDLEGKYEQLKRQNIRMILQDSGLYPKRLKKIKGSPYCLYVKGKLPSEMESPLEKIQRAAIVGARNYTPYGAAMTRRFSEALAKQGMVIVSGMAKGIDGIAQRAVLEQGGTSVAVLGCGTDICYPKEHFGLYMDLQEKGGIVSEFPPGTPPYASNFPTRNRIISGLADLVLVMEAQKRSGSLITAEFALEQGKDVYALPGPVTSSTSEGCNQLIRDGAGMLTTPEELFLDLKLDNIKTTEKNQEKKIMLERKENIVYSCLGFYPKGMESLLEETGFSVQVLMQILLTLELKGYIQEISKNHYVKV